MARSRLHRRYRRARSSRGESYKHNPPLFTELAEYIGPGFAAFAGTRLLTRVASVTIAKHKPSLGKHAGALASVGAFLGIWFLAHKWKWLEKYQQPMAVGAGLATLQTLLQTYIPKLGWIVSDATPDLPVLGAGQSNIELIDDDPNNYSYNDSYDSGRMGRTQQRADRRAAGQPDTARARDPNEDLLSELDLEVDDVGGVAAQGGMAGGSLN